jgi:hypothetical protein
VVVPKVFEFLIATVMNFPRCLLVTLKVDPVAFEIAEQVEGFTVVFAGTDLEQEYH